MKIYTKSGDGGETSLCHGERVSKDAARVNSCGEVDELNSYVGWARSQMSNTPIDELLAKIQSDLFIIGADIATPNVETKTAQLVMRLTEGSEAFMEDAIDRMERELKLLKGFILPGGTASASALHICRAVCRRAERAAVALSRSAQVNPAIIVYLNRLSDLLFVMARFDNQLSGIADVAWSKGPQADE